MINITISLLYKLFNYLTIKISSEKTANLTLDLYKIDAISKIKTPEFIRKFFII